MAERSSDDDRTLWVGNLHSKVTEELLWELFFQAGPLESVKIPKDFKTGQQKNYAFVRFQHQVSVPYVIDLMDGISLFKTPLKLCFKKSSSNGNIAERQEAAKHQRIIESEEMHHPAHLLPMNPNLSHFGGSWGFVPGPPHLMAQYPQYPMQGIWPPMVATKHSHPYGEYREGSPRRRPNRDRVNWDGRPRGGRWGDELHTHRSPPTPGRFQESHFDRRNEPRSPQHDRRRR